MAKVIMVIAPEDGMDFGNILSFKTENYIGIWDSASGRFVLMHKCSRYFEPWNLDYELDNLSDLDKEVFKLCEEHITEVFDKSNYTITLD